MTDKLSREKLERILRDCRERQEWRYEADRACDYYDGNQLDADVIRQLQDRGMAPLIRNLVGPTVDLVLGMEAKNRRDWRIKADDDDTTQAELAEAVNIKLHEAERIAKADRACSDAYASQIKAGIGWVEVNRESNPFKGPYRVTAVHRGEIEWDWRAKEPDLSDSRYLVRKRWLDLDVIKAYFPSHSKLIDFSVSDYPDWNLGSVGEITTNLMRNYDDQIGTSLEAEEWRDSERQRAAIFEVWYRHFMRGHIMRLSDGTVMEFDQKNPMHRRALATGLVEVESAVFPKMRLSWWIGPHQLDDYPTPLPHHEFPYIPFWGMKEDRTNVPYGLVRRMMSPQDEINSRLSKMMWLLSAKRLMADSDALDMSWADAIDEVGRPDAALRLNPNRRNPNQVPEVSSDFQLSAQQFQVMKDASQAIQDSAGVYQAMLGKDTSAESGLAISSLVEQGSTTLAEINDNYRYARVLVGERLLALVREDIGNKETPVRINFRGVRKTVVFNKMETDEDGRPYRSNLLQRFKSEVVLDDVPDTPSYRNQVFQQIVELGKSLPPEIQTLMVPAIIKVSDLPNRAELAEQVSRHLGLDSDPENKTPEQVQAEQREADLAARAQEAEVALQEGKAANEKAKAEKAMADIEHTQTQTEKVQLEMDLAENQDERADSELQITALEKVMAQSARNTGASKAPKQPTAR